MHLFLEYVTHADALTLPRNILCPQMKDPLDLIVVIQ